MKRNPRKIIRTATVSLSVDFFKDVLLKMSDMGYETLALTSPGEDLTKLRDDHGIHICEVEMERHISILKDLKSLIRLISVFAKEKPQMVHSITPKAGLLCMVAAWLTRVPVRIHTFTGLIWPTATGLKRKILLITDWITCTCATHVIPEGQGVLNDLKNHGVCSKPMKVLGYGNVMGVDMKKFNPDRFEKKKEEGDPFTFVFVGRVVGDKGINELVNAFCRLNKKYPNTKIILIGDYERNLDPLQLETDEAIAMNPAIEANGPCYGDNLLQEYVDADCFVMPSYREGFPNSVLEAGAMGLASIVTNINGSREIIENGKNGLIVPSKDADALYVAMETMLIDVKARSEMEKNARIMIESRFERNFVQSCQIEFYNKVLN